MPRSASLHPSRIRPPSCRLVHEGLGQERAQVVERGQRRPRLREGGRGEAGRRLRERGHRVQAQAQPHEIAGVGDAEGGAGGQPFQVAHAPQQPPERPARLRRLHERLHRVLTGGDGVPVEQRLEDPAAQQTGPHRGDGLVDDAEQRVAAAPVAGLQELQRAHRRLVEAHRPGRREAAHPGDVAETLALGGAEVAQGQRRRLHAGGHAAEVEGVEGGHPELAGDLGVRVARGARGGLRPRQRGAGGLQARQQGARRAQRLRQDDLGRPPQQRGLQHTGAVLVSLTLADREVAGGGVEQGDARPRTGALALAGQREQEVVRGPAQVRGVGEGGGRDDAHDVAPQELPALAGRLQLLAERHLEAGLHQARDVPLGGVVRDPGHRGALPRGERDAEDARGQLGILEERLVEVAQPEQQQVVGVPALERLVLLHHRRGGGGAGVSHRAPGGAGPTSPPGSPAARAPRPART
jgi:hypothetical protein